MNGVIEIANYEFEQKKRKELKPAEERIYNALYSYVNVNKKIFDVYPSVKTLQKETGLSSATVIKHLKSLVQKGWIAISKKKAVIGNYNIYSLKVIWNNTKTSFFDAGKKLKENNLVKKVNNIIKKDKPVEVPAKFEEIEEIEVVKTPVKVEISKEIEEIEEIEEVKPKVKEVKPKVKKVKVPRKFLAFEALAPKNEEELKQEEAERFEFLRKGNIELTKRVVNPYHRLTDSFIRILEKATREDVFMDVIFPMIDKVNEENTPVALVYLENALKIALNNKKYANSKPLDSYYDGSYATSSYATEESVIDSSLEDDDELIGWF